MTQLLVHRDLLGPDATLSRWYLDGVLQCHGVEDAVRAEKIAKLLKMDPKDISWRS